MQFLRNLFYFFIAVAMLGLGALFAVQNEATVPLDLLVILLPERSIALWVLLAFALGGVTGLVTSLGIILRQRTALAAANRRIDKARAAVARDGSPTEPKPKPQPAADTLQES